MKFTKPRKPAISPKQLPPAKSVLTASRKIVAEAGIPGVKYAMDAAGYYGGPPRAPFLPLTATQRDAIDAALRGLIPSPAMAHPIRRAD